MVSRINAKLNRLVHKQTWLAEALIVKFSQFICRVSLISHISVSPLLISFGLLSSFRCMACELVSNSGLVSHFNLTQIILFLGRLSQTQSWLYQGCIVDRSLVKCPVKFTHTNIHKHTKYTRTSQALCQLNGYRSMAGGQPGDREAWSCMRVSVYVRLCSFVWFHVSVWVFICACVSVW